MAERKSKSQRDRDYNPEPFDIEGKNLGPEEDTLVPNGTGLGFGPQDAVPRGLPRGPTPADLSIGGTPSSGPINEGMGPHPEGTIDLDSLMGDPNFKPSAPWGSDNFQAPRGNPLDGMNLPGGSKPTSMYGGPSSAVASALMDSGYGGNYGSYETASVSPASYSGGGYGGTPADDDPFGEGGWASEAFGGGDFGF